MNNFFKKFNKVFTALEKKGQTTANAVHKTVITGLVFACGYQLYALGRDYNAYFREVRVKQKVKGKI